MFFHLWQGRPEFVKVLITKRRGLRKKSGFEGLDNGRIKIWFPALWLPLE
jgi:hypothetical protein